MHPNAKTLQRFYTAFAALDDATMGACYAADATFSDPAFTLNGKKELAGMWSMLCSTTRSKGLADWRLEFRDLAADATTGHAHWEAHYRFSATGRLVHNIINSTFTFNAKGLIVAQKDSFNFWRWSRQSLGTPGLLLGWTPFLQSKVRAQAASNLKKYLASKN